MEFYLQKNIDFQSVFLESKDSIFSKDFKILLAFILLILLEVPVFLIIIKIFANEALFKTFLLVFTASLLALFVAIFLFAHPKLFLIHADREKGKLLLGWIKYLVIKSFQEIRYEDIESIKVIILDLAGNNKVVLNVKEISGQTLNLTFTIKDMNDVNEITRVLINLSNILGFHTYTAFNKKFAMEIKFSKYYDLVNRTDDLRNIKYLRDENEELLSDINIPDIKVDVKDGERVSIIRKPNLYDLIRVLALFVVFPVIIIIAFLSKDPYKYHAIIISLAIYSAILFYFKKYLVPIQILFHRLSGEVLISRAFLMKTRFHLSNVREIEIRDFRQNRMGSLIFEVLALLNNNKKILLFFVETSLSNKRTYEIFVNILSLVNYLVLNYNVPIKDSCKSISNI